MSKPPSPQSIPSAGAATPSAATPSRPVHGSPSFYHILVGLSVMSLGTIFFWSISRSLAEHRLFPTLHENTAFDYNRAGYSDSSADTCRPSTCVHLLPLPCHPASQFSSLLSRFEVQVQRLEELTPQLQCPPSIVGKDSDASVQKNVISRTDEELLLALKVFLVIVTKIVGLVLLHEALGSLSPQHSSRALAFDVVGMNIGAFYGVSGLAARLAVEEEVMWDVVMLMCLVGMDMGCILGGDLALGRR